MIFYKTKIYLKPKIFLTFFNIFKISFHLKTIKYVFPKHYVSCFLKKVFFLENKKLFLKIVTNRSLIFKKNLFRVNYKNHFRFFFKNVLPIFLNN